MTYEATFADLATRCEAQAETTEDVTRFDELLEAAKHCKALASPAKAGCVPFGGSYRSWDPIIEHTESLLAQNA